MKTPIERFYPLIPAGGVGSRLWPLSRATVPKFLLNLTGGESSLLRSTYDRLVDVSNGSVMVVTGVAHANRVTQQIDELRASDLVLEPSPRDSAAAIGLACAIIYQRQPDAIIGSFAADHVIEPVDEFQKVVTEAVNTAATGKIVTIGITPTEPSTAFGYIRATHSLELAEAPHAMAVAEFVEKPDAPTAAEYISTGDYTWNAGMFVAPAELMLKHLEQNEPELHAGVTRIARAWDTPDRDDVMNDVWETLPKIAIDYAVAEPAAAAGDVAMVPGSFSWDDIGDFDAVARLNLEKTDKELFTIGDEVQVFNQKSTGIIVAGTHRKIAVIGIEDVVIVDTPDALLVTTRKDAQDVKNTVNELKSQGLERHL
ncbi:MULTISPECIES: mannose-1-phosphate guanylyltransferase [unclassified Rothia (in: high G+C Gram-positive bacteria)]|uniref:mannose-1-phosphate guanylyltransferase n=1 Tax=unclassified Rothia (in: high G+C Gram-positive bacteria) TaxID=2689056 RepID=UPI00195B5E37|nr:MULTISPECIES: mannose-1-phosphate guanylyltransferase [unclassified Rothia (in: high G+C Gram-positive bacteria)]MBM7051470.1 mannose-1-phosphate guanylyltransferase [Rothia sp. ZJ1223]QRZ61258.1 mannose-1-phosphate guanylyltransferase [Rothia sp. ZJ932]